MKPNVRLLVGKPTLYIEMFKEDMKGFVNFYYIHGKIQILIEQFLLTIVLPALSVKQYIVTYVHKLFVYIYIYSLSFNPVYTQLVID